MVGLEWSGRCWYWSSICGLASGRECYRKSIQGRAERCMHARNSSSLASLLLRLCRYSIMLGRRLPSRACLRWRDMRKARKKENARKKRDSILEAEKKRKLPSRTKRDKMNVDVVGVLFWYFSLAFGVELFIKQILE